MDGNARAHHESTVLQYKEDDIIGSMDMHSLYSSPTKQFFIYMGAALLASRVQPHSSHDTGSRMGQYHTTENGETLPSCLLITHLPDDK